MSMASFLTQGGTKWNGTCMVANSVWSSSSAA